VSPFQKFVIMEIIHDTMQSSENTFQCFVHSLEEEIKILILPEIVCRNFIKQLQMDYFFCSCPLVI
jgi:hypothetical protein